MKIIIKLFLVLFLFSYINTTCATDEDDQIRYRDSDDCENREFDSEEIGENAYKCCHMEIETKTANVEKSVHCCIPLTQSQFENIKQTVREYEAGDNVDEVEIDCKSSYLRYGLFLLVLFIL